MPHPRFTGDEIATRGEDIYKSLRSKLETSENIGKMVSIDIESGAYEIDQDSLTAAKRLLAARPDAALYGKRIGYDTAYANRRKRDQDDVLITGRVESFRILVNVPFRDPHSESIGIEFIVDTGFEGALTLPHELIAQLNLQFIQELTVSLADNAAVRVDTYAASIEWDGRVLDVPILALGQRPQLGTELLANMKLNAQFIDNGRVEISSV